jgi:glycosyltransferase involved in cell wall biosynthesis
MPPLCRAGLALAALLVPSAAVPGSPPRTLLDYRAFVAADPDAAFESALASLREAANVSVLPTPHPAYTTVWMAPFFSGGGYCSEALAFAQGIVGTPTSGPFTITQHGDAMNSQYMFGLPPEQFNLLQELAAGGKEGTAAGGGKGGQGGSGPDKARAISICHSEPGAWQVSATLGQRYSTSLCPLAGSRYRIGRTMFETDRLPDGWAARMNGMDEVWVPTDFMRQVALKGGVQADKLLVVPEPVDTDFFDPARAEEAVRKDLAAAHSAAAAFGDLESTTLPGTGGLGTDGRPRFAGRRCTGSDGNPIPRGSSTDCPLRFLSVGKWERRKGFDVLLRAYLTDFTDSDHVELYILTSAYHSTSDFNTALAKLVSGDILCDTLANGRAHAHTQTVCVPEDRRGTLPVVRLLTAVPQSELHLIYGSVDVLVQPSRGEGWGRPHVEAMAMGLPIIATEWSGPSEFLTEENGYPLQNVELTPVPDGAFAGHLMAEPDVVHLATLLRRVMEDQEDAARRGAAARRDMLRLYRPSTLGKFVVAHLERIRWFVAVREAEEARRVKAAEEERRRLFHKDAVNRDEFRKNIENELRNAEMRLNEAREDAQAKIAAAMYELDRPRFEAEAKAREEAEKAKTEKTRATQERDETARRTREARERDAEASRKRAEERVEREREERERARVEAAQSDTDLDFNDLSAYAAAPVAGGEGAGEDFGAGAGGGVGAAEAAQQQHQEEAAGSGSGAGGGGEGDFGDFAGEFEL